MPRGQRISDEKKKEIDKLYKAGVSVSEIAFRVGVGYTSVYELTVRRVPRYPEKRFKKFEKPALNVGEWYTFRGTAGEGSGNYERVQPQKMKLLAVYPWHALFVSKKGIRRCYQWFDIMQNMV